MVLAHLLYDPILVVIQIKSKINNILKDQPTLPTVFCPISSHDVRHALVEVPCFHLYCALVLFLYLHSSQTGSYLSTIKERNLFAVLLTEPRALADLWKTDFSHKAPWAWTSLQKELKQSHGSG